jgi:hypothetical protein
MGTISEGLRRNVKKDIRVRGDCLAKFQKHNVRIRGDERRVLIDRTRKEEHYRQLESMLCCQSSSLSEVCSASFLQRAASSSRSCALSEEDNLLAQLATLVAIVPVDVRHPLLPLACRSLDILQSDLRAVDDAPLPNSLMKGLDGLIKAGVFHVLDALQQGGPHTAQIALEVEDALHKSSPPFSIIPLRTKRFEVIAHFVDVVLRSNDVATIWGCSGLAASTNNVLVPHAPDDAPSRDDLLLMGSSIMLTLLEDGARRRDVCSSLGFFPLVSSLFCWRPTISARLLAKVCRCSDSVGPLFASHSVEIMHAVSQLIAFYRDVAASGCAESSSLLDCMDVVYYGYVCLNALLPHAPWNALEAKVAGELPHLNELGVASKWDKGLMGELLAVLRDFSGVVQQHQHLVFPFLQEIFRNRSSLRDAVLEVLAASPGLFVADEGFLCNDLFPHYRARGVSRARLLDALAAVCRDHRDKIVALVENENALGWITVMPDDELSEVEHEKLDILLECLGIAGDEFWGESPTWGDEGLSPTTSGSHVQFLF